MDKHKNLLLYFNCYPLSDDDEVSDVLFDKI